MMYKFHFLCIIANSSCNYSNDTILFTNTPVPTVTNLSKNAQKTARNQIQAVIFLFIVLVLNFSRKYP